MVMRFGPGPVFEAECLTASRRVQFYSARVLLVVGLLIGLGVVWLTRDTRSGLVSLQDLAGIGRAFYTALMGVELSLALTVAPAAAAGAICLDRARGGLSLLMTTQLTDSEIVLGRLASRLLSTLGVVACGLPVLALATLLGGVDPLAIAGGTLVVVGVASLSVGMALTFSLWAGKPHEALSATYAVWAVWMLAFLAWDEGIGRAPEVLRWSNPFWLLFSGWGMPTDRLLGEAGFFAGCLAATAALAGLSTWKLRSVTFRREGKATRAEARRPLAPRWLRAIGQAAPALDDDPILWREWHRKRPSPFSRSIWWAYAMLSTLFAVGAFFGREIAPGVNGFQIAIGLLLACVGAATALSEERAQGGLDVVLATPIDSRTIVMGKWWGAFRIVPRLAILPALLTLSIGLARETWPVTLGFTALAVGMVLAYGASITGLGLLIAIAQPRPGRAVALMVACYLGLTVAYPAIALPMMRGVNLFPLSLSPFFGLYIPACQIAWGNGGPWRSEPILWLIPLGIMTFAAFALLWLALATFDRGLGRVVDRPRRPEGKPKAELDLVSDLSA
jgi:ABC-type transport system involved in multi-copper enzyme maturation permease subunit